MKLPIITIMLFATMTTHSSGQSSVVDSYIELGLKQNLALKQERITLEQAHKSLDEARGGLLPSLDFSSRYTKATGGRDFEIPTGDLMNPVYTALNNITGENSFPQIENQVLNFNRRTDVDTRLTLSQPLFDRRLWLNKNINEEQIKMRQEDVNIQKREIVAEVKKGYFNYLKTVQVLEVLNGTKALAEENLRISESMFANDKVTQDVVWRSKSDLSEIEFQIAQADKNHNIASSYFNYLLNRELETPIEIIELDNEVPIVGGKVVDPQIREEWNQLEYGKKANQLQADLSGAQNLPNLYAAVDYGFQGTEYTFTNESDYSLASLVLSWNIFGGGKNKAQKQRAVLESQKLALRQQDLSNSIQLEAIQSYYSYQESFKNRQTATDHEIEAKETYRLIERKFLEGLSPQIDLMDARNNLTTASLQKIITHYDLWIAFANHERATASYLFKN